MDHFGMRHPQSDAMEYGFQNPVCVPALDGCLDSLNLEGNLQESQ